MPIFANGMENWRESGRPRCDACPSGEQGPPMKGRNYSNNFPTPQTTPGIPKIWERIKLTV